MDALARLLAHSLPDTLGHPVVVENHPGAGRHPTFIARLNGEVNRALSHPALSARPASQAVVPAGGPPESLDALVRADAVQWPALVRAAGARLD